MNKFSIYYGGITKLVPDGSATVQSVYNIIKSEQYKELVEKVRNITHEDKEIKKKLRNQVKKNLSYITAAGIFKERNNRSCDVLSGYAAIDIDDLSNNDLTITKNKLSNDPHIALLFESPSGEGLKALIKIPLADETTYSSYVVAYYEYLNRKYDISIESLDSSTKDISRACFLSYDIDAIYNDNVTEFKETSTVQLKKTVDTSRSAEEYRVIIRKIYAGVTKKKIYKDLETYSKWSEATESYKEYTYNKALSYVESNPPSSDQKKDLVNDVVQDLLETQYIHTLLHKDEEKRSEIYIYSNGIYVSNGRARIEVLLDKRLGRYYNKILSTQIIDKIIPKTRIDADEFFEEADPKFLCVQNGILNLIDKTLLDFTPKMRFFNKLPVKYDITKTCHTTLKHFNTILYKEDMELMQELYGYLLYKEFKYEKVFLFSGDGGNGKGKTVEQIKCLLGAENCTNLSLETIEKEKFMLANVHKKMANLGADIGNSDINETRNFKQLSGHDMITVDRKHGNSLSFTSYAKMIFNANTIPYIHDTTDGFRRRWIFIRFDVCFVGNNEYKLLESKGELRKNHRIADTSIIKKLTDPDELSGVLNWAVEGLERLFKNNSFSYYKTEEETNRLMKKYSSSSFGFLVDCVETVKSSSQFEDIDDLYKHYIDYCFSRKKKLRPCSEKEFRDNLTKELPVERKRVATGYVYRAYFCKFTGLTEER